MLSSLEDQRVRGALARISTPDRCSERSTAPCDSPNFFSSSAIVAPASYSIAIVAASLSLTFRLEIATPCSRNIRVSAEFATFSSRASDRTLSPSLARWVSSSTLTLPSRFDSSWLRYRFGVLKPPLRSPETARFWSSTGVNGSPKGFE